MSQKDVNEYEDLAGMALFRVVDDFDCLKEVIKDFERVRRVYSSIGSIQAHQEKVQ